MTDDNSKPQFTRRRALTLGGVAVGGLALGNATVLAQNEGGGNNAGGNSARTYRVTITNLTQGQPFTPPAVALHRPSVEVFSVGDPANEPTQELAENGNLEPLATLIDETNAIRGSAVGDDPLVPEDDPGETDLPYFTELEIEADASATKLTFISMLIATNDGIVGLDTVDLPEDVNESKTLYANGYDVGTEENTELFADMVPEAQTLIEGGEAEGTDESNPAIAEDDVIRPHEGITGDGDLDPEVYDWQEPAAVVQVERIESIQDDDGEVTDEEIATDEENITEDENVTEDVNVSEDENVTDDGNATEDDNATEDGNITVNGNDSVNDNTTS